MNEMVERVARAMCVENKVDPDEILETKPVGDRLPRWHYYAPMARAAIKALRHPPRDVLDEVIHRLGESTTSAHWDTMIDVILAS